MQHWTEETMSKKSVKGDGNIHKVAHGEHGAAHPGMDASPAVDTPLQPQDTWVVLCLIQF